MNELSEKSTGNWRIAHTWCGSGEHSVYWTGSFLIIDILHKAML